MCFLSFALIAMLVYSIANRMQAGTWLGVLLILVYCGFLITCMGLEVWGGSKLLTSNMGPRLKYLNSGF